jgi:hypothetical protein
VATSDVFKPTGNAGYYNVKNAARVLSCKPRFMFMIIIRLLRRVSTNSLLF